MLFSLKFEVLPPNSTTRLKLGHSNHSSTAVLGCIPVLQHVTLHSLHRVLAAHVRWTGCPTGGIDHPIPGGFTTATLALTNAQVTVLRFASFMDDFTDAISPAALLFEA